MDGSVSPPTFRDPDLQAALRRDGYAVVDLVGPDVIDRLLAVYERHDSGIHEGYYPSLMSVDEDYKVATHREVTDLVWPSFGALLDGYQPLLGVFMVKHPGPDTEVVPHQDWIVADESGRPTMNAWVPLTPVDAETGTMRVLPGSHRWLRGLRGSPSFPTSWEGVYERVRDELMVEVPVGLGQAMVYDIRILHGTPANRSATTRVVASLYAIPDGATPVHYHRDDAGVVRGYRVPTDFCTTFAIGDVPDGEQFVEIADYAVEALAFDEIAERHARAQLVASP
jgi:hypothetical protein